MAWQASRYAAVGALVVGGLAWAGREAWPWRRPVTAPTILVRAAYVDFTDTLSRRKALADVLAGAGITGRDYGAVLAAATALDTRRLRRGLVFHFRRLVTDSAAHRVMVRPSPDRRVWLARRGGDSGWVQAVEPIAWVPAALRVSGAIETSLYDAFDRAVADSFLPAAERIALAWAVADVYDWEIDFTRDIRPGDRFDVLLERLESADGERRFGSILAARVDVARTPSYAFYFETGPGRGGFYDESGRSLRRAFLRSPLKYRRISSRFGTRYHPLVRVWRSHEGTDYAAATGTPVRATADGIVTVAGRDGGYGNLIEVRHAKGIRTRYGHLGRFAPGVHVGARVHQDQTIGFVGSTGLSTGPHLHYEFVVNGRATNPQRKDAGAGQPVPERLRAGFDSLRVRLLALLEGREPAVAPVD